MFESRCLFLLSEHSVKAFLGFRLRDVADRLQQPAIVEPVHPGQRRELDGLEAAPGAAPMDHLGLVAELIHDDFSYSQEN